MPFDSDVALLGTGVAPLVAASHLLSQGKSVLILNPDRDFFLEDSELPLDPLIRNRGKADLTVARLKKSLPDEALAQLRPDFPGAVEFWAGPSDTSEGYHDTMAPHVRQRGCLWIAGSDPTRGFDWETLEETYVEASDAGLNPQIWDGLQATKRFPGFSAAHSSDVRGLFVPKTCDVDVSRYRNGLLEFVRERLGPEHVVCGASQTEIMPGGVRFHHEGAARTAKISEGILVFWTPRLSAWILAQSKKFEVRPKFPRALRLWEEWSLTSRDPVDLGTVGIFSDMAVWADHEGAPGSRTPGSTRLAVLRPGNALDPSQPFQTGGSWASAESFAAVENLCTGFLKWDRFSVRSMKPRAIFEWDHENTGSWALSSSEPNVQVVGGCDGPLVSVVREARQATVGIKS